jgi:hypothetical protein
MPTTMISQKEIANIKSDLLFEVRNKHLDKPQYAGHWDNWVVAQAKRDIKDKYRDEIGFKDDFVLLDANSFRLNEFDKKIYVTVYLPYNRGGMDTVRPASEFKVI